MNPLRSAHARPDQGGPQANRTRPFSTANPALAQTARFVTVDGFTKTQNEDAERALATEILPEL